ncbi:MAG: class I SAM-dependent methyltransferase [Caulobacterales bacterium]|nr:class I SAM-dependent methyltransferase [Caulobacterales bacterium]
MHAMAQDTPSLPDPRFWDRISEKYAKQPVADPDAYRHKLDLTRRYLTPESIVLEFGCGTGSTAITLADAAKEIHATDISEKMLAIAADKARKADVANVHFRQGTLFDAPFEDGSLDAVFGFSILHLLRDKDAAVAKVYDLLKPGGVFVSSTVCIAEKMGWFALIAPIGRALGFFPYVSIFKIADVKASVEGAGFTIVEDYAPEKSRMVSFLIARKPA